MVARCRLLAPCLVLLSITGCSAARAAGLKNEWLLLQRHYKTGNHEIRFCPNAIKISDKTAGYSIVSRAPKWDVIAFRVDDKVMCTMPRSLYYAKQNFRVYGPRMQGFSNMGTQVVAGMPTKAFQTPKVDVYTIKLPGASTPIEDLLIAYYDVKVYEGIALKLVKRFNGPPPAALHSVDLFSRSSGSQLALETKQVKQIPYNPADFVVPSGLREIDALEQIKTSEASRKSGDEIFNELGVGEKLGNQKQK